MRLNVLLDDFVGEPQDLYNLVVEEINKRQLPNLKYDWAEEGDSIGWLSMKGAVNALRVRFGGASIHILAYQIGRCFNVSARMAVTPSPDPKAGYLREVALSCFVEVVDRATRAALLRHLEARSAPVPDGLDPQKVFFNTARPGAA